MRHNADLSRAGCHENKKHRRAPALFDFISGSAKPQDARKQEKKTGWPGRVRSTGRVAQRQEAAPCGFSCTEINPITTSACALTSRDWARMMRLLVATRPGRSDETAGPPVPMPVVEGEIQSTKGHHSGRIRRVGGSAARAMRIGRIPLPPAKIDCVRHSLTYMLCSAASHRAAFSMIWSTSGCL